MNELAKMIHEWHGEPGIMMLSRPYKGAVALYRFFCLSWHWCMDVEDKDLKSFANKPNIVLLNVELYASRVIFAIVLVACAFAFAFSTTTILDQAHDSFFGSSTQKDWQSLVLTLHRRSRLYYSDSFPLSTFCIRILTHHHSFCNKSQTYRLKRQNSIL